MKWEITENKLNHMYNLRISLKINIQMSQKKPGIFHDGLLCGITFSSLVWTTQGLITNTKFCKFCLELTWQFHFFHSVFHNTRNCSTGLSLATFLTDITYLGHQKKRINIWCPSWLHYSWSSSTFAYTTTPLQSKITAAYIYQSRSVSLLCKQLHFRVNGSDLDGLFAKLSLQRNGANKMEGNYDFLRSDIERHPSQLPWWPPGKSSNLGKKNWSVIHWPSSQRSFDDKILCSNLCSRVS